MAILSTTTNFDLENTNSAFNLAGIADTGLKAPNTAGEWCYESGSTTSDDTGPTGPQTGTYYWYTETGSPTDENDIFIMELIDTLDAGTYNYTVDFYYSNYGIDGHGQCLVQYWDGGEWDNVLVIGWDEVSDSWKAATSIDLSSYSNSDGKFRWHFTILPLGGQTFHNDFALDNITFTVEADSSSSSSLSSSSLSSSSSSSSLSSSSSSSSLSSSSSSLSSSSSSSSSSVSSSSSSSSISSSSSSTSLTLQSLKHFWYMLRDDAGVPRGDETVYAYKEPSGSEALELLSLYDQVGLSISNPLTTSTGSSANSGIFEFYLKDEMWNNVSPSADNIGYEWDQRIRIVWDHDGEVKSANKIMTWGDYHPIYDVPFDPLDFSLITPPTSGDVDYNDKNKAMSNSLAFKIECHMLSILEDDLPSSLSSSSTSSSSTSSSSSSSSTSSSSSITPPPPGQLTFIMRDDQGDDYEAVWGDGTFIYVAAGGAGIRSYEVDGAGILTHKNTHDQGGDYKGVWADAAHIYAVDILNFGNGLISYTVDGAGILTYKDNDLQGTDGYRGVWSDGTFIYVVGDAGIRSYSVDGAGILTYIDTDYQGGDYYKVWGDGTYIYVACDLAGLRTYSVDGGGNLTYIDTDFQGSAGYLNVWGDGNFIYAATYNEGLRSYSVDGAGNLTYIDVDNQGGNYYSVWGDGTFIFAACRFDGIRSYEVDGGGNFTFIDVDKQDFGGYVDVWCDGTFIYAACDSDGIRSYEVST